MIIYIISLKNIVYTLPAAVVVVVGAAVVVVVGAAVVVVVGAAVVVVVGAAVVVVVAGIYYYVSCMGLVLWAAQFLRLLLFRWQKYSNRGLLKIVNSVFENFAFKIFFCIFC